VATDYIKKAGTAVTQWLIKQDKDIYCYGTEKLIHDMINISNMVGTIYKSSNIKTEYFVMIHTLN
jgi:hypothetical protein